MTMSLKMLADIATHAQAMADEAQAMAAAMQIMVDDCAEQLAAKKYTITEVRAFVAERTKPENRAQVKVILKGLGVSKLTELPEDKYGLLMDEVSKL